MAIADEINETRATPGTAERGAQVARRQFIQMATVLEMQLNTVTRLAQKHGLVELKAALDLQTSGDGNDMVTKHASLVAALRAVKPDSTVLDLE